MDSAMSMTPRCQNVCFRKRKTEANLRRTVICDLMRMILDECNMKQITKLWLKQKIARAYHCFNGSLKQNSEKQRSKISWHVTQIYLVWFESKNVKCSLLFCFIHSFRFIYIKFYSFFYIWNLSVIIKIFYCSGSIYILWR